MSIVHHIIKKFFGKISLFCQHCYSKLTPYTGVVMSGALSCTLFVIPLFVKSNRYSSIPSINTNQTSVLEITPSGLVYLPSIDDSLPNLRYGELISFDSKLYCTNTEGLLRDNGMIFSLDPANNTYKVVRSFKDGVNSTGTLTKYNNKLYGITEGIRGRFFSLDPNNSSFSVLNITGEIINYYSGTLLTEYNNKLFGVSEYNRGKIFSLEPDYSHPNTSNAQSFWKIKIHYNSSNKKSELEKFNNISQLTVCMDTLYGHGYSRVSKSYVIFSMNPATDSIKIINKFGRNDRPTGSLTVCNDTLLYGMCGQSNLGGYGEKGMIFLLNPAKNTFEVIHDFKGQDGINPTGSLTFYDGKLYGMTTYGGSKGKGVFFSFDPTNSDYTILRYSKEKQGPPVRTKRR